MLVDEVTKKFFNIVDMCEYVTEVIDDIWMPSATENEEKKFLKETIDLIYKIEWEFLDEFINNKKEMGDER